MGWVKKTKSDILGYNFLVFRATRYYKCASHRLRIRTSDSVGLFMLEI